MLPGDTVVITGGDRGGEARVVIEVAEEGRMLVLDRGLESDHESLNYIESDGRPVDIRNMVAVLGRNIVIRGGDNADKSSGVYVTCAYTTGACRIATAEI